MQAAPGLGQRYWVKYLQEDGVGQDLGPGMGTEANQNAVSQQVAHGQEAWMVVRWGTVLYWKIMGGSWGGTANVATAVVPRVELRRNVQGRRKRDVCLLCCVAGIVVR